MFGFADIIQAAARIHGRVVDTPVLNSPMLDAMVGATLFMKAESLQFTGSFKIRGALNKILSLTPEARSNGVFAYSSGNHGHAVAAAAKLSGCQATILLPQTAAKIKVDNCRWWGAEIIFYDPAHEDREELAARLAEERKLTIIPPFDDHLIMAGQGTAGKEMSEYLLGQGKTPDVIMVNCSGGGVTSGVLTAMRHYFPNAECYFVEPAGYEKMAASMVSGQPERNAVIKPTILDGIAGPIVGKHTFPVIQSLGAKGLSIDEDEALGAMAVAFRYLKLVLEPGAAASLAAVLSRKVDVRGKTVAMLGTGGNVDPQVFARAMQHPNAQN